MSSYPDFISIYPQLYNWVKALALYDTFYESLDAHQLLGLSFLFWDEHQVFMPSKGSLYEPTAI